MGNDRERAQRVIYEIRIQEELDESWSVWFDGLEIRSCAGTSLIVGPVADQAALSGILNRIWDLNLTLTSIKQIGHGGEERPQCSSPPPVTE